MKRSGFKRPPLKVAKQMDGYTPRVRAVAVARTDVPARMCVAVPKLESVRDEGYLRLVASLPCAWCGINGYSQAAHANQGKGMAMKACDRTAFPLCCDRPLKRGCHLLLDQTAGLTKERRRELEELWGNKTRMNLRELARGDKEARAIVERVIGL